MVTNDIYYLDYCQNNRWLLTEGMILQSKDEPLQFFFFIYIYMTPLIIPSKFLDWLYYHMQNAQTR